MEKEAEAFAISKSSYRTPPTSNEKDHKKNKMDRHCDHSKERGHTVD